MNKSEIKDKENIQINENIALIESFEDNTNSNSDNNHNYINDGSTSSERNDTANYSKYSYNSNSSMSNPFSGKTNSDRMSSGRNIYNYEELSQYEKTEINEIKDILEYSSFEFHTDEDKNIEFDEIKCGKEQKIKNFEEIKNKRLNLNEDVCLIYKKFLAFISWFKDIIKEQFIHNYKLEGKLEFKIDKNQDNNEEKDMECLYYFKKPDNNNIIKYIEVNCLSKYEKDINLLEGFECFLSEINKEDYKDIDYIE